MGITPSGAAAFRREGGVFLYIVNIIEIVDIIASNGSNVCNDFTIFL